MSVTAIFLGTPVFAIPALDAVHSDPLIDLKAVITQPDKPAGRGRAVSAPPVKTRALELGLDVYQPKSLKNIVWLEENREFIAKKESQAELARTLNQIGDVDFLLVAAYGKIIPKAMLDFPRLGSLNIHPSLLPRWRGAAPIHLALFSGDQKTGVTIMQVDEGLDSGAIFIQEEVEISADDTLGSLHDRLSSLGAELLCQAVKGVADGSIASRPQDESLVTYAEKWDADDCEISWSEPVDITLRRIRTCYPKPGAKTQAEGKMLKIFQAREYRDSHLSPGNPGEVVELTPGEMIVSVGTQGQFIEILEVQLEGKKRMRTPDFLRGFSISLGSVLGK